MWKSLSIFAICVAINLICQPNSQAQQEIPAEIAKLPGHGVVGVKLAYSLGGVTIRENTGMAIVLSASPLVIVTTQDLLIDSETIPSEAALQLTIQTYIATVGGMGGMGMGGMGMGGYGDEGGYGGMGGMGGEGMDMGGYGGMGGGMSGGVKYQAINTAFSLRVDPGASRSTDWQFTGSDQTPLLFGFAPVDTRNMTGPFGGGSSMAPATPVLNCAPGQLAEQAEIKIPECKVYRWLGGATPVLNESAVADKDTNGVAISPKGSLAVLTAKGRPYGRSEILEEYLMAYKKLAASLATEKRPLDVGQRTNNKTNATEDPFGGPSNNTGDPFSGNNASLGGEMQSPFGVAGLEGDRSQDRLREAIVDLVVQIKSAESEKERTEVRQQLQMVLSAEFNARRSLKSQDIAALKARIEALEQAEQKLVEQRESLIQERLEALLR